MIVIILIMYKNCGPHYPLSICVCLSAALSKKRYIGQVSGQSSEQCSPHRLAQPTPQCPGRMPNSCPTALRFVSMKSVLDRTTRRPWSRARPPLGFRPSRLEIMQHIESNWNRGINLLNLSYSSCQSLVPFVVSVFSSLSSCVLQPGTLTFFFSPSLQLFTTCRRLAKQQYHCLVH